MQCLKSCTLSSPAQQELIVLCHVGKSFNGCPAGLNKGPHTKAMHTLKGEPVSPAICAGWHVPRHAVLLNQNEGSTMS